MARVFITGSADGLGQLAARELIADGHQVCLHARNGGRAQDALNGAPGATGALAADLSDIEETKRLAAQVNALGRFDAVIHNAAVYQTHSEDILTVNVFAPYILTCLIEQPKRLIYMSSGMHTGGNVNFDSFRSAADITYSDSKLYVLMLAKAIARRWPDVSSNAVDPGWVPTKMGGENAPDDVQKGVETQVWLAVSDDPEAKVSGRYFHHKKQAPSAVTADDIELQDWLLHVCEELTGVRFP
jgi:NAD(P)-dependent dehydrogenase (short-subunit alcohol dehydrogenase family)